MIIISYTFKHRIEVLFKEIMSELGLGVGQPQEMWRKWFRKGYTVVFTGLPEPEYLARDLSRSKFYVTTADRPE